MIYNYIYINNEFIIIIFILLFFNFLLFFKFIKFKLYNNNKYRDIFDFC